METEIASSKKENRNNVNLADNKYWCKKKSDIQIRQVWAIFFIYTRYKKANKANQELQECRLNSKYNIKKMTQAKWTSSEGSTGNGNHIQK